MPSATALVAAHGLPATSCRESDDNYFAVLVALNTRWRVIACRDGIQWILQQRDATRSLHGAPWRGRSYFRTRDALICVCAVHAGPIRPEASAILRSLPAHI